MDVIEHYKKKLLRHIEDPDTVLYCLKKLNAVPVTIDILQESEVGKVVNRLKKRTDTTPDVITSSKALVEEWKELVKKADEVDQVEQPPKAPVKEHSEAVTSSSSKSKTPSDERKSSSSSTSSKNHHHKKDKKEKHKEKSEKSHHKHHKSHKSSSKEKEKEKGKEKEKEKVKVSASNGSSSNSASGNGNIEIPSDINPNYKPPKVRQRFSDQPSKNGGSFNFLNEKSKIAANDEDALTAMMNFSKSGQNRTKVYSGRKTSAFSHDEKFPSLIQLCVHVLQDNVSRIDECGNLPYDMLKPILERGKPDDIMRIEDYNPRLIEDTGELWERIVKRQFPKGEREEFESYREMYERLIQEREDKYNKLMGKFANSYQNRNANNRQTKMTFVDEVAKPPRGVKRAQEKNGTAFPVGSSHDKVKKIKLERMKIEQPQPSNALVPKKITKVAPMMAKTMKMARGLKTGFRR